MSELDDLGSGIVSIPIALLYASGVLKYEEAKEFNRLLMTADAPNSFAELCMQLKTAKERLDERLAPVSGS